MKISRCTLIFLAYTFACNLSAQDNLWYQKSLADYAGYISSEFGIDCSFPEKLRNMDRYYVMWKVREDKNKHTGGLYGPIFQSRDKGCIIMYTAQPRYISAEEVELFKKRAMIERELNGNVSTSEPIVSTNQTFPRGQITAQIKTALGLYYSFAHQFNNDSTVFNFNDYVTIIAGEKPREMFNADSIYIYDIPSADSVYFIDSSLEKMRKRKYPYCTGVFISKDGRASMEFKLFFTKNAKKEEEKYFHMLNKQIWYDENFKHE